jgi:serine O-acetyltransferase
VKSLKEIIKADLYRHEGLSGFRGFLRAWYKPGFRYFYFWRLVHSQKLPLPVYLLLKTYKRSLRIKYGFEISKEAKIGEGFYLTDHIGPVVIGPVVIGKYCNIAHNVTIGRAYRNGDIGRPTIGDRVWIGTGSVLVGKINIGSNVMIAPNTFLNMDVPANSVVIGNPAQIIAKDNPTKYYINYILHEESMP